MTARAALACGIALMLFGAGSAGAEDIDPLHDAEAQEQSDLERLRAVNAGELEFLTAAAETPELHTRMQLALRDSSLRDGWVDMQQCQSGLDGMPVTEIVYRYEEMRELRVLSNRGIDAAHVEGGSVQLRGVMPGAEICVAAMVRILRPLGEGRYRIVSGPYHRRFFDGYFPMRLSLEVTFPAQALQWQSVHPPPQPGHRVVAAPGRVTIDTRFTGRLTVELDFAQPGYATPQPPSPQ